MAVASARVASIAINQEVDPEELGGWRLHSEVTGLVDVVVESDEEALAVIRQYLGYLPSHSKECPPEHAVFEEGGDQDAILQILPESKSRVYDVRDILRLILDRDSLFELKPNFGKPIVSALARLGGKSVGILASNPKSKGGAIDVDSMRKATAFLVHCDSYNIPLIFYVDQPGFLIGLDGERHGAPGKIMNWMNALQLVTVPKVTVIARKDYGQAYLNMCGGHTSDWVILWPTADLGFMDPSVGVNVLHNVRQRDDPERFKELRADLERDTSVWDLAALYEGHMVIDPRETRSVLLQVLGTLRRNLNGGVGEHLLRNWPTSY